MDSDLLSADPLPDPRLPDTDDEDDTNQVLGHIHDDGGGNDDEVESSPVAGDSAPEARDDQQHEDEDEPATQPSLTFNADDDSDDEEIKKLEAEANVASDDEVDESSDPVPKSADGQLIADIFGDSDSEDEQFEVSSLTLFSLKSD